MPNRRYLDLEVWQKSMIFVVDCYKATEGFPRYELYGLSSQLRRAAVSIPSNIAEGQASRHLKEFVRYLSIAYGSLMEAETQLRIAHRLGYMTSQKLIDLLGFADQIESMLKRLIGVLEKKGGDRD